MSRKMNRRQMSPVKIKPNIEQRRNNLNAGIHRIINHAAKLMSEYDRNSIDKLLDEDLDIQTKIDKLMKESVSNLPKISMENNPKISRKRKRKKHSTGKNKKNNAENESDKIEYNFSFEDEEFDSNKQPSKSEKHRNSLQSNNSVFSIETDQKMEDLSKHNDDMVLKSENQTIFSDLSIEKSTSCSICSEKHFSKKNSLCQPQNEREVRYIYEIEIKTANETFFGKDVSVSIQLYGLSKNMVQSIKLNEINSSGNHAKLFTPGNVDKFSIILDEYLGSIESVKIGIESENEDTLWNLDYLCVRDCSVKSDYFFSCRRCLGINSSDRLTHVTLVYTPPYKLDKHDLLSKSNTENLEDEKFVESIKSKRTISKSNSSSRSQSSLSQKSDQIQQLEIDHDFSAKHKESKNSDNKDPSEKRRSRKTSSTISNDEKSSSSSQRSLSSPESARSQLNKGVYPVENSHPNIDIHSAVRSHDVLRVKQLCKNDENKKDKVDENGCKPIHLASVCFQDIEECKEILQYFISLGIDINTKSTNDFTCLHYAVIKNNLLAVRYLIEYCGANPNVTDKNGDTSLQIANKCNFPDIAKYLASIKNNNESKENISLNEEELKLPIPNSHQTNKNQTFTDLDQRNQDKNRDETIENQIESISITNDRNISSKRRVSSDSEKSVNSQIIPLVDSFSNLRDRSSEKRASVKSSDSNRSTSTSSDDSDITVKSNSKLLRSTDNKEITTIAIAHKQNSSLMNNHSPKSHDSREGIISLDQPILMDNLSLTPNPASADNNSVNIAENLPSVESKRKEINKTISNKDSLESRQLEEENYGLMLHKSLPDREDRKFQNKFKDKELSESKVNIDNSNISPITPRPNSVDSLSNIKQTTRNNEEEDLNKNSLVAENLLKKNDDNDNDNSVKISENFFAVESERNKSNKMISDKDSRDNFESRQLEAESQGLMLQKSLPIRKELKDEELSSISSNLNESKISSRMSNISPVTPRSNSSTSISDSIETNRNQVVENSNENPPVTENVQTTTENLENKNENLVQSTSTEENSNKNHNNIPKAETLSNDKQKDHSISKGQFQSTVDSN